MGRIPTGHRAADDASDIPLFLADTPAARGQLRRVGTETVAMVTRWATDGLPAPALGPDVLAKAVADLDLWPDDPIDLTDVLDQIGRVVLANGVRPSHPHCAAHLHSPTLLTAAAAELAVGATNQSLDSYDQAPAATLVEDHLTRGLAARLGLPAGAGGVMTAGGTASNLLGLYLAREHHAHRAGRPAPAHHGLTAADGALPRLRILCSRAAHFSIEQAAAVLGLGRLSVVTVPTDRYDRIDLGALDRTIAELPPDAEVTTLVGTAGTTDAGAVDPLPELADRARRIGAWFHVDAAVGGAFCVSDRLRPLLDGVGAADSVTVDLHKLWWQPIGASVLLARDVELFGPARQTDDYLDRPDDGLLNLVGRSLDTSRRFDALKVLISLRTTGRKRLADLIEHLVDTVAATAAHIDAHPDLELLMPPATVTVLFRWRPRNGPPADHLDRVNTAVQRDLFAAGEAVVGRTRTADGAVALKLTVVNPLTTADDLTSLIERIADRATDLAPEPTR